MIGQPNEKPEDPFSLTGFKIHEEIARGGMAIVYRATQSALNRSVAIKVLRPDIVRRNPEFIGRFKDEAQAIARLSHPYILPIYDYGSTDAFAYIVMQHIPGGRTLRAYKPNIHEPSNWMRIVEIGAQIADALSHAHTHRIIHCDIKPSNILWHETRPLLADFGLARLEQEGLKHGNEGIVGTPAYMAPEQFERRTLDGRADIYSLGLVLYQLITGILPHTADSVEQIATNRNRPPPPPSLHCPDLPPKFDSVLLKALAVNADDRYSSAADFRDSLEALLGKVDIRLPSTVMDGNVSLPEEDTTLVSPPKLTPFQAPLQTPHFVDHVAQRNQILEAVSVDAGQKIFGLVGLAGGGKTALATQVVHDVRDYFPDGVLWTQLDATTPSAALLSFGNSFGQWERIAEAPDLISKATAVRQILANKRVLSALAPRAIIASADLRSAQSLAGPQPE